MKNKILICTAVYMATNISMASAATVVTCEKCTNDLTGKCFRYDITCCDPCKNELIEIPDLVCTTDICSGETTTVGDTCIQTETKGCDNNICKTTTTVSCKAGYYGELPTFSVIGKKCTGCTQCPSSGGIAGDSIPGDNATVEKCFIPSGSAFSDDTGSGVYTGNCYYSK